MRKLILAVASLVFCCQAQAQTWNLVTQSGLTQSSHLAYTFTTQSNGTASNINVIPGGPSTHYFLQRVEGDSKPEAGPPWASWLATLSDNLGGAGIAFVWPTSSPMVIAPGKTYKYGYFYDLETGSQEWEQDSSGIINIRARFWKTYLTTFEEIN